MCAALADDEGMIDENEGTMLAVEAGDLLTSAGHSRRHLLRAAVGAGATTALATLFAGADSTIAAASANPQKSYADGRPSTTMRLDAVDHGPIIRHGTGPAQCDYLGAREAICFRSGHTYYLHYDGAGPTGWRACLAESHDLRHWQLKGPVLDLGEPGTDDSGTASSPWTIFDGKWWHMFYVGCRHVKAWLVRQMPIEVFIAIRSVHLIICQVSQA